MVKTNGKYHTKDTTRKALMGILSGFNTNRQRFNWMWGAASKSPMLTKKPKKDQNGKSIKKYNNAGGLILRSNRLSRAHPYNVFVAGAAAEAYRIMTAEAHHMRLPVDAEPKHCPAMPTLSDGARTHLEHVIVAIVQTYFARAVGLKNVLSSASSSSSSSSSSGPQRKVTGRMQEEACRALNERICRSSGIAPGIVHMLPISTKKKKNKKKPSSHPVTRVLSSSLPSSPYKQPKLGTEHDTNKQQQE